MGREYFSHTGPSRPQTNDPLHSKNEATIMTWSVLIKSDTTPNTRGDYSQTPHVHRSPVATVAENFWSGIGWGPALSVQRVLALTQRA